MRDETARHDMIPHETTTVQRDIDDIIRWHAKRDNTSRNETMRDETTTAELDIDDVARCHANRNEIRTEMTRCDTDDVSRARHRRYDSVPCELRRD